MAQPVAEKKEGLFWPPQDPVLQDRVDLRQVFRPPLRDTAQEEVQLSVFLIARVSSAPQEGLLIFCKAVNADEPVQIWMTGVDYQIIRLWYYVTI